ncbi:hypothetical protein AVEN_56241-1 [Araneus ventricosus]|uniref:Uncharacterized protein n=1 Tax=Araneus ventricosus TaxID=182803 RepID=A0A4Y2H7T1_ARAVE|nr:hypothetical protein AVEN_56241-1 [Araneus ventricosus]
MERLDGPACSPDLAPLDFPLFPSLKLLFNELSAQISPEQVLESAGVYVRDAHDSALVGHIPLEHGLEDGTCHSQDHPVSSVFLGGGRRPDDEGDVRKLLLLQLVDRGDDGVLVERGGRWAGVSDGKVILDVLLGREMKDIKTSLELVNRYTHIYLECTHADPGLVKAMRIAREAAEKQPAQYKDTQGPHKLKKRQGVQANQSIGQYLSVHKEHFNNPPTNRRLEEMVVVDWPKMVKFKSS